MQVPLQATRPAPLLLPQSRLLPLHPKFFPRRLPAVQANLFLPLVLTVLPVPLLPHPHPKARAFPEASANLKQVTVLLQASAQFRKVKLIPSAAAKRTVSAHPKALPSVPLNP